MAATRRFDKRVYVAPALDEALTLYEGFGSFTVDRSGSHWTVSVEAMDPDIGDELLAAEFSNYVLAETIARKRA